MHQEDEEEDKEQHRLDHQMLAAAFHNLGIVDIIDEIKQYLDACQEEHRQSETYVPEHESSLKPVPGGRPGGDHRHRDIGQLSFVDDKLGSAKKRTDSRTQQDRTQDAVQQQEYLIRLLPRRFPFFDWYSYDTACRTKQASISIHTQ